jgi:hypothetical protein
MTDQQTPETYNTQQATQFRMVLRRAPSISYFCQRVDIPDMSLDAAVAPSPFVEDPHPGDHMSFGELDLSFKLDERLQNYMEVQRWMLGLGFPESFDQHADLERAAEEAPDLGLRSDLTVNMLTSSRNASFSWTFVDAWPTYLGKLPMDSTLLDPTHVDVQVVFKYTYFTVVAL